jgi:phage host-nuclease inhibitor protein Gam
LARTAPAPAKPAIQSDEQAGIEAQEYKDAQSMIEAFNKARKASVEAINKQFDELLVPYQETAEDRFARVQAWAEATRAGRKTVKFPNGRVFRWRTSAYPKLIVAGTLEDIVKSLMKRRDWKKFVDFKLKKTVLTANPQVVEETDGLRLERNVYVSIG